MSVGDEGWSRTRASRRNCPLIRCQLETSPRPQPAGFTATQPQCLSHSCYHHCLFTLNYYFSPRAQTPSQVLPVRTSASAPTQLLRHAITSYRGEILQKHIHIVIFFSHQALWRSNYIVSLIIHWEKCVWLMCERFTTHFKSSRFSRGILNISPHIDTYKSRCPADFLTKILLLRCSLQSARWYFINANDKNLITPASLMDKERLRDLKMEDDHLEVIKRDHSAEQQR